MPAHLSEGFSLRARKAGEIEVLHFGKRAAPLRGHRADEFRARASVATESELQHLTARATGDDKGGNERRA